MLIENEKYVQCHHCKAMVSVETATPVCCCDYCGEIIRGDANSLVIDAFPRLEVEEHKGGISVKRYHFCSWSHMFMKLPHLLRGDNFIALPPYFAETVTFKEELKRGA